MKKSSMILVLMISFMFSIVGCGTTNAEKANDTTESKSEQKYEQENETEEVSESIEMNEETLNVAEVCVQYLLDNEPAEVMSSITNLGEPGIRTVEELPDSGAYMKISDEPCTGQYYIVTFTTTQDDMLGPLEFIVNQEEQIVGIFYRE